MLGLAIWMLSRILPEVITLALWGLLVFMAGVFLGGLTTLTPESSGSQKLGKGFGLIAVFYGPSCCSVQWPAAATRCGRWLP